MQVDISILDVEFYTPPHHIALQPRNPHPKWGRLGDRNPNDIYCGKRIIVNARHDFKGYKGTIKTTTPDGDAFVELDSRLQYTNYKFSLLDLALL
jgi:hypothetical protein